MSSTLIRQMEEKIKDKIKTMHRKEERNYSGNEDSHSLLKLIEGYCMLRQVEKDCSLESNNMPDLLPCPNCGYSPEKGDCIRITNQRDIMCPRCGYIIGRMI